MRTGGPAAHPALVSPPFFLGGAMKLKKCPFCARDPEIIEVEMWPNTTRNLFTVVCECGAESPKDSVSKQGAARIWNRRRLAYLEQSEVKRLMEEGRG